MVRNAAVAGSFYPADEKLLGETVSRLIGKAEAEVKELGACCAFAAPHAGYVYSGQVAAYTYAALGIMCKKESPETIIVLGPNHTGYGEPMAVSLEDWQTPMGTVKNDKEFAKELIAASPDITADETAHAYEHSIEVQLPFIQKVVPSAMIAAVCMGDQSYAASSMLADAIANAREATKRKIAVIASSDFNHYESADTAREKDMHAIHALKTLDVKTFNKLLHESKDSACGYGPITTAALFASKNGAKEGRLLKYGNSGEVTNDYGSVVAYASIAFL